MRRMQSIWANGRVQQEGNTCSCRTCSTRSEHVGLSLCASANSHGRRVCGLAHLTPKSHTDISVCTGSCLLIQGSSGIDLWTRCGGLAACLTVLWHRRTRRKQDTLEWWCHQSQSHLDTDYTHRSYWPWIAHNRQAALWREWVNEAFLKCLGVLQWCRAVYLPR